MTYPINVELPSPEKKPSEANATKEKRFDLDDILRDEIGQWGRYQFILIALVSLPVIFGGFAKGEYIFTTARIPTRCHIPECDSLNPEYTPNWLLTAINGTSLDSFDQCERFANLTTLSEPDIVDQCPAQLFDQSQTVACESYVYENTNTVVYDFGLACDEWRRSKIGSIRTIGNLLVLPVTGYISDRWGRRVALSINAFNTAWLGFIRSFVNTYEWFVVLEVLETTIGAGTFSCCHILVMELVGSKYRVKAGALLLMISATGQIILGFLAWAFSYWRTLTQVLYVPQLIVLSYFWILPESIRWHISKGQYDKTEAVLKKVATINKKELSEKSLTAFRISVEEIKKIEKLKEKWLPLIVFQHKTVLLRCCIVPIWWITQTLIYYGLGVNAVNLSGNNQYLNYVFVAAVAIPGYWTAILLLDRIGRKLVLIFFFFLCGACQFGFAFMPAGHPSVSLTVYLIGRYSIAVTATTLYLYTSELYPTKYRHSLFAFSSMIGRIGEIIAPMTPALAQEIWPALPSVMFGSMALLSGSLVFLTPETLGTKLPDTMEEAEGIGKKGKKDTTDFLD